MSPLNPLPCSWNRAEGGTHEAKRFEEERSRAGAETSTTPGHIVKPWRSSGSEAGEKNKKGDDADDDDAEMKKDPSLEHDKPKLERFAVDHNMATSGGGEKIPLVDPKVHKVLQARIQTEHRS